MTAAALTALIAIVILSAPITDEVRLVNGRVYSVSDWWVEGDSLVLVTVNGRIRVPRSQVEKIVVENTTEEDKEDRSSEIQDRTQSMTIHQGHLSDQIATPQSVLSLIERGNIAAALQALEQTSGAYVNSPDFQKLKGSFLIRSGYFAEAENLLRLALDTTPETGYTRFLMAQALYFQGRWSAAIEHYRESLHGIPDENAKHRILERIREIEQARIDLAVESDHFIIQTISASADGALMGKISESLERLYMDISAGLNSSAPQRILVVVTDSPLYKTEETQGEGAYDGKIIVTTEVSSGAHMESLLAHELVHALLLTSTAGNCPIWLHEGLAQFMSGLRSTHFKNEISAYLLDTNTEMTLYPESLTLTEFLIERFSMERLQILLSQLRMGLESEEAIITTFGASLEQLRSERDEWLRNYPSLRHNQ